MKEIAIAESTALNQAHREFLAQDIQKQIHDLYDLMFRVKTEKDLTYEATQTELKVLTNSLSDLAEDVEEWEDGLREAQEQYQDENTRCDKCGENIELGENLCVKCSIPGFES